MEQVDTAVALVAEDLYMVVSVAFDDLVALAAYILLVVVDI